MPGLFLNFRVYEYCGCEVIKRVTWFLKRPVYLFKKTDLKPGDRVILWYGCECEKRAVVVERNGCLYAESGDTCHSLQFDIDDRHCWVSIGAINKNDLESIKL